jgi:mono/diheme cytochrome c family protein
MMAVIAGCSSSEPDALPNDPMRVLKTKMVAPIPDAAMAERSGQSQDHLGRGYSVFMAKCIECHEPRIAVKTTDPSWLLTMHGMSWNAGIDAVDEEALVDYLRAAAED